jgi:hypothetical protein
MAYFRGIRQSSNMDLTRWFPANDPHHYYMLPLNAPSVIGQHAGRRLWRSEPYDPW